MAVTDETEAEVRRLREEAVEYAERVAAGEEPWKDEKVDADADVEAEEPPKDEDVGETGEAGDEVVEVSEVESDDEAEPIVEEPAGE
jgi:hypothetical protein